LRRGVRRKERGGRGRDPSPASPAEIKTSLSGNATGRIVLSSRFACTDCNQLRSQRPNCSALTVQACVPTCDGLGEFFSFDPGG
jgi:hypothetical protein